jgi:hypothetical protein
MAGRGTRVGGSAWLPGATALEIEIIGWHLFRREHRVVILLANSTKGSDYSPFAETRQLA